tara:strand:+ start:539 stop:1015 length:477 start_codon:yes stop_codon:yes gene_type:complete
MIQKPVIGIPVWRWKKQALAYARKNPRIIEESADGLCHECHRHMELLSRFDDDNNCYSLTEYFRYKLSVGKKVDGIIKSINRFYKLYESIKESGKIDPPIITDDGCRLDGSHRTAIANHLGWDKLNVNVLVYEDLFDSDKAKKIREQVRQYRKKEYEL